MTLEQCTKEELIQIINRISFFDKSQVNVHLHEIEYKRTQKRFAKADEYGKIANENLAKYCELLKPYEGKKVFDIPNDIILQAAEYQQKFREAQKKELELIKQGV